MKSFVKNNFKYIFLFIFFFCCLQFFFALLSGDQIYNYGFSYAISRGEIPYQDFNMIVPPVGAFLYAIPLKLFGVSLIIFNLFQALLLCVLFYFLFKLFGKKAYLLLIGLVVTIPIPIVTNLFQGYNFLLLLELVVLLYLEKSKANDYLIGIILGLAVFTKQTVGFCFCLVSIYYLFKDYKKVIKRLIGVLVPCFIFLIYFLGTKTLGNFLDMCLFGLFDFTTNNSSIGKVFSDFYFYVFLLEIGILIYQIAKDRKRLMYYYLLAYSVVAFPLFDYIHISYFTFPFLFIILDKINVKEVSLGFPACLWSVSFSVIWFLFMYDFKPPYIVNFDNFELFITSETAEEENRYLKSFLNKYPNTIILAENTYFTKISMNLEINHYDLLNYGNHGYNGTNKLINRLVKEKNKYILVNMESYNTQRDRQQTNKEVMKYVIDNYEKKGVLGDYDVFYKE